MKKFILLFLFISNLIYAQEFIKGKFNPKSNFFQQKENAYWISEFQGDFAKFSKAGYYGIINKKGEIILPLAYDEVHITDSLFYAYKKNTHSVFTKNGALIDQPTYDLIIKKKGILYFEKWQQYKFLERTSNDRIYQHGNAVYDYDENFITDVADNVKISFADGISVVNDGHWKHKKFGYINKRGEKIIPIEYDYCSFFRNGRGIVTLNKKNAVIDKKGNFIVPFTKSIPSQSFYANGLCRYLDSATQKYSYMDTSGLIKIAPKYDKANNFHHGFAKVVENGKPYTIDTDGNKYSTKQYGFVEGYRFMENKKQIVYENKNGEKLFTVKSENHPSELRYKEGLAIVKQNGKEGAVDKLGTQIIPPIYDNIEIDNGYVLVRDDNEIWLLNKKGEKLILVAGNAAKRAAMISNYSIPYSFNLNGFLKTRNGEKLGVVNSEAQQILPNDFDRLYIHEYHIQAIKNEEMGIYNLKGELVVPHALQSIVSITNKGFIVKREHSILVFDRSFKPLFTIDSIDANYPSPGFVHFSGIYAYKDSATGKYGYLDVINLQKSNALYKDLRFYPRSRLVFLKNEKTLFNPGTNKKEIVDFEIVKEVKSKILIIRKESDEPTAYIEGFNNSGQNKRWRYGIINHAGEIVLPVKYKFLKYCIRIKDKRITVPKDAILFTQYRNEYLFIDQYGKIIS